MQTLFNATTFATFNMTVALLWHYKSFSWYKLVRPR
jgi:hypothetical protein